MVNEDEGKSNKKPVPLPRKSLLKQNKITPFKENGGQDVQDSQNKKTEGKGFVRDDWKSASGSFVFEKSRLMKNEVQKLEKSVKNIIRRKSVQTKRTEPIAEHIRSDSLPDDSVFLNISFNSPLTDDEKHSDSQSTSFSEDNSLYESELSPPAYPPPDLPDESVYDTMRSFSLSDQQSCKSTSSDSTSVFDEVSASQSVGRSYLNKTDTADRDRYEVIDENPIDFEFVDYDSFMSVPETDILSPDAAKDTQKGSDRDFSNIKYIIHLFDPLQDDKTENCSFNLGLDNCTPKLFSESNSTGNFGVEILPSSSDLNEGHYGKITKIKSTENEYVQLTESGDVKPLEPPPIPPRRFDSQAVSIDIDKKKDGNVCEKYENVLEEKTKPSDKLQWSSLKRVAKKVAGNIESRASYISGRKSGKMIAEETSSQNSTEQYKSSSELCSLPQSFPKHSGVLLRAGGIQRWGVLSQRKLTLFANKDSPDVKETVPMDNVLSVNVTHNRISAETSGVYCFEISISSRSQPYLFGVPSVSERHIWMRKLLESVSPSFPAKLSMDYTKAGWCYAKESVSCPWSKCCVLLHNRTLYLSSELGSVITADLRKARTISLQNEGFHYEKVTEKGPLMLIDLQDKTLYLQMDYERETKAWEVTLTAAALKNGPTLCEQQLTKDDVPAIVDKCLNFVHTHGTFSEGIYRRNGSNRTINQLLASFRCNAWSVQLSKEECTEFDVSSVLKRYFRDLPEPLLVPEIHGDLGTALKVSNESEKIEQYKSALNKLPRINYLTARRLMGHLYFINKQKDKNLMGAENLAAIWGPNLLQVQEQVSLNSDCFKMEALVVTDLIRLYPEIFDVDEQEVEREMKILEMLESYHKNSSTLNKKPSGELKVWVYLHSPKNVDGCINTSINPQKTAEEVCRELSFKANEAVHLLCLEEVICSGHLTRPLNHSEKVLDTVLRWSYWDEADRKDNCLVLGKNDLFREVAQSSKFPFIVCEEFKFADQKSRSFKSCQFEFSQAKLICFKDKSCSQKIGEWKVEDIVWYIGHEPKRIPNSRWSITFVEKKLIGPRTKERPYFGNTICGNSEEQKFKLISAMLTAQYAKDILPTPNFME